MAMTQKGAEKLRRLWANRVEEKKEKERAAGMPEWAIGRDAPVKMEFAREWSRVVGCSPATVISALNGDTFRGEGEGK